MSDKLHLLTLPMEIRCHIYSFIYLEGHVVDFLRPKFHYTETALFLSCRQLSQETLEYYYARNVFSLPLWKPFAVSDWRFHPKHFNLVKVLHLKTRRFFWKSSGEGPRFVGHVENCQQRLRKYLNALFWANQGIEAPRLKTLIFADRAPGAPGPLPWGWSMENSKDRIDGYVRIFEELHIEVGQVVVKFS